MKAESLSVRIDKRTKHELTLMQKLHFPNITVSELVCRMVRDRINALKQLETNELWQKEL